MSRCFSNSPPDPNRRENARNKRIQAADIAYNRFHPCHHNNCEEHDYPYIANYSKGLAHDGNGDVLPASYNSLLTALQTRNPADFEAIQLGPGGMKLTNPQAGLAFDLEGADTHAVTMPPAPRIDSAQVSSEMAELYWMALARDVHFNDYSWNGVVQQAIQSLNTEFSFYQPRNVYGSISAQTVFRGIYPGEAVGPYISQFLLKGTSDPGAIPGQGTSAADGFIRYGALKIDQRRQTVVPGVDYLTDFWWWLMVQDGADKRGDDQFDKQARRFIRNLRDLANFVHFDMVGDAFFNAAWILIQEPTGDQLNGTARPNVDREFPFDQMNPYLSYIKQAPFATYGDPHLLSLIWEVLVRALRAVWYQKWFVHRRLRPEELGGRIDNQLVGRRYYGVINGEILNSLSGGMLSPYYGQPGERFPHSYLLPQAYPEGAPTHPSYGAGHATGAGALATILKAFFNEDTPIENPVVASPDGLSLMPYTGWDAGSMTVGGELNKLAANIAIGRNAAGVHWFTDYSESLLLGEQIAIRILQEQSLLFNEGGGFMLTRFDGTCIKIWDGHVDYCWGGSIEPSTTSYYAEECPTTTLHGEETTCEPVCSEETTYDYQGEETTYDYYGEETTYDYYGEEETVYSTEPTDPEAGMESDQVQRPLPEA
jgi:membrane-associated phospholipid phosphatase